MKRLRNSESYKLNNVGMSLVEVIIAIAIMSVISIPILRSFVTSANYDMRSRERQRATSAAQSIMEGFKAYDMEELSAQFNGPVSGLKVYNASAVNSYSGTAYPAADNNYEFVLKKMHVDGKDFDVRIKASPMQPTSYEMSKLEAMNPYLDAVCRQDYAKYTEVFEGIAAALNNISSGTYTEVYADTLDASKITKLERECEFVITKASDAGGAIYTVKQLYRYKYKVDNYPMVRADGMGVDLKNVADEAYGWSPDSANWKIIYDNTDATMRANGATLDNLYYFYYPAYDETSAPIKFASDKIIFNNQTGEPLNVYLAKQKLPGLSETKLNNFENAYRPTVQGYGDVTLYHNLNTNLHSGGNLSLAHINDVTEASATTSSSFLTDEEQVLLYKVEISVYKDGAADAGFTGVDALVTLNGSINSK